MTRHAEITPIDANGFDDGTHYAEIMPILQGTDRRIEKVVANNMHD